MTLILKPPGRGGWASLTLTIPDQRREMPRPLDVRVGQRIPINGIVYRVAKVLP